MKNNKNNKKIVKGKLKGGQVPGVAIFEGSLELVTGMIGLGKAMATEVKSIMELPGQMKNASGNISGQPNVTKQPTPPPTSVPSDNSKVLSGPVPPPPSA